MEPVSVRVRDCACPGAPHGEGDVVFLAPHLTLEGGLAAQGDILEAAGNGRVLAQRWRVTFVRHGAIGWNLVDERGKDVPFDVEILLGDFALAYPVSEKADDLYGDAVMRPLLPELPAKSLNGSTGSSTSPKRSSRSSRGRSSPAITADTEPLIA